MSKWREPKRGKNPLHGMNTLIVNIPEGLTLGSKSKYNGLGCGVCVHFEDCKHMKGVIATTDYCQLSFNGFTPKEK